MVFYWVTTVPCFRLNGKWIFLFTNNNLDINVIGQTWTWPAGEDLLTPSGPILERIFGNIYTGLTVISFFRCKVKNVTEHFIIKLKLELFLYTYLPCSMCVFCNLLQSLSWEVCSLCKSLLNSTLPTFFTFQKVWHPLFQYLDQIW